MQDERSRLDIVSHGKEQKQWYFGAVDETFSKAFQLVGLPVEVSPPALRVINECAPVFSARAFRIDR